MVVRVTPVPPATQTAEQRAAERIAMAIIKARGLARRLLKKTGVNAPRRR
jgi:hypothetical protein